MENLSNMNGEKTVPMFFFCKEKLGGGDMRGLILVSSKIISNESPCEKFMGYSVYIFEGALLKTGFNKTD